MARIFVAISIMIALIILSIDSSETQRITHVLAIGAYIASVYYSKYLHEEKKHYSLSFFLLVGGFFIYLYAAFATCANKL